ncbi:MAG: protein-disulfide reductase DsbD domain-containing protein, partial [Phycisphaerales bacterium]
RSPFAMDEAQKLYVTAKSLFYVEGEGWYDTEEGQSDLFVRTRALSDGAMPAATSLIFRDQIELAELTGDTKYIDDAMATLDSESQLLQTSPLSAVVASTGLYQMIQRYPERFNEEFELALGDGSPVRMSVDQGKLSLPAGGSNSFQITLRLAKGWHVNSNSPGNEYAVPLSITSLDQNVTVRVAWPKGESVLSAGERVEVYGGTVALDVTLTANANANGNIPVTITWQACDSDSCLAKETTRIPCAITVE